jgi:hypothetical protein
LGRGPLFAASIRAVAAFCASLRGFLVFGLPRARALPLSPAGDSLRLLASRTRFAVAASWAALRGFLRGFAGFWVFGGFCFLRERFTERLHRRLGSVCQTPCSLANNSHAEGEQGLIGRIRRVRGIWFERE